MALPDYLKQPMRPFIEVAYGDATWVPDPDTATVLYTEGRCGDFAVALHRLTGWDVVIAYRQGPEVTLTDLYSWVHALCRRPDGQYVDVLGPQDEPAVTRRWARFCEEGETIALARCTVQREIFLQPDGVGRSWCLDEPIIRTAHRFITLHHQRYLPTS